MSIKKLCMIFLLVFIVLLVGCKSSKGAEEPPQITVSAAGQELNYLIAKNKWKGEVYDREDTFISLMKEGGEAKVPYLQLGEIVEISFHDNPPDRFDIYDIVIDENGRQLYQDRVTMHIPVELQDGKCSFVLEHNLASYLSSTFIPGKKTIRGIRMFASWGKDECEYALIIKSDK